MLKCDVLDKTNKIDFHSLPISSTFIIKNTDANITWIGMKVKEGAYHEKYEEYVMDLSDEIGRLYEWDDRYNIIELIDLKVVKDEGDIQINMKIIGTKEEIRQLNASIINSCNCGDGRCCEKCMFNGDDGCMDLYNNPNIEIEYKEGDE